MRNTRTIGISLPRIVVITAATKTTRVTLSKIGTTLVATPRVNFHPPLKHFLRNQFFLLKCASTNLKRVQIALGLY